MAEIPRVLAKAKGQSETDRALHPIDTEEAKATDEVYDYWSKAAYWHPEEAVALLLERDPRFVNWKIIKKESDRLTTVRSFRALSTLLDRALTAKQIDLTLGPGGILAWAHRSKIPVPQTLEESVRAHGHKLKDWQAQYERRAAEVEGLRQQIVDLEARIAAGGDKGLSTRERESLLKIVLAMAVGGYGFDPEKSRNATATEIAGDLHELGLNIDPDTVRKYLADARELAPRFDAPDR